MPVPMLPPRYPPVQVWAPAGTALERASAIIPTYASIVVRIATSYFGIATDEIT